MKIRRLPWPERLFIACGLLLTTTPNLFNVYIKTPDFFRGALMGAGIVMETWGFIQLRRKRNADGISSCRPVKSV